MILTDDLTDLDAEDLVALIDRGLAGIDVRGNPFVTLKGRCLQARSARDVMLLRLGLPLAPALPRPVTGEAHFTVSIMHEIPPELASRDASTSAEARQLAEARNAARLAGEMPAELPRHLRAV